MIDLDDDKIITTMSPLVTEGVYLADGEQHLQHRQSEVEVGDNDDDDDEEVEQRRHNMTSGFAKSFPMPIPQKKQQVVLQQVRNSAHFF